MKTFLVHFNGKDEVPWYRYDEWYNHKIEIVEMEDLFAVTKWLQDMFVGHKDFAPNNLKSITVYEIAGEPELVNLENLISHVKEVEEKVSKEAEEKVELREYLRLKKKFDK